MTTNRYFIIICFTFLLFGCSITKYIEEDKSFYTGAQIKYDTPDSIKIDEDLKYILSENLSIAPNKKNAAWYHFKAENAKRPKGLKKGLNKAFGEKPVYYDENLTKKTVELIQASLNNNGYFGSRVKYKNIQDSASKSTSVDYYVVVRDKPYVLDSVNWNLEDKNPFNRKIKNLSSKSILKKGNRYSLQAFRDERTRINTALKDSGYYYFSSNYLMFDLDSANEDRTINVYAYFKEMPDKVKRQYEIDTVILQPDFDLDGLNVSKRNHQKVDVDSGIVYYGDPVNLKPKILNETLQLRAGETYSRHDHQASLKQFSGLGVFKYVNMEFEPKETLDPYKGKMKVNAKMSQVTLHSVSTELSMSTWSTGYTGPELDFTWKNRNTFGGAERFSVTLFTGIQKQFGGNTNGVDVIFWYGFDTKLSIPRVIAPFDVRPGGDFYIPYTNFGLGFKRYHFFPSYSLNYFNTSYGFDWRTNEKIRHTLNPVAISYQATSSTDGTDIADAFPSLAETFRNQFILGSNYTFEYAPSWDKKVRNSSFYYKGNIDISGNMWYGIMQATGIEKNQETGQYQILGNPFSQYVKLTNDLRFYFKTTEKGSIATRLVAGYSVPWGNSTFLPFVKQYFVGGPNSLRAFRSRTLGPGSYKPSDDKDANSFSQHAGDIKLEGSVEYRYDLHQYLKLAAFVDYGNVWLASEDPEREGGEFEVGKVLDELAVGGGVGLRVDVQFFVLRLDFAMPFRVPYTPDDGDQWVIKKPSWNQLVFNLAIGYPF
ncbi:BamA/TamA family outer membrane protein [Flammeovirga yaeyamensis]|uniref:BamA/TamA family outer membrane protein n=1 Tax=Flammeovirga yaeyamensis TaxID=367791 RepID=A0AAX1N1V7_9BACT|nr:BamA/TamA family outer membrane protein [Flammeovirga yaeyamensis]MBB3696405.1 outer membrane protein assembly factor BamA [Flammeovirga yaeyamensis]NMF35084.1 BamA/TamA family outer membrane protein [Flammeovirga yaeyamensis]QWG00095.1 BamA/TamA family outer membrane protein [Flammeovirga yaeyamensis]